MNFIKGPIAAGISFMAYDYCRVFWQKILLWNSFSNIRLWLQHRNACVMCKPVHNFWIRRWILDTLLHGQKEPKMSKNANHHIKVVCAIISKYRSTDCDVFSWVVQKSIFPMCSTEEVVNKQRNILRA